ncbi:zinc-binding dehydrogenase [Saccharibacillus sacchari]|uniref:Zinc-binding dehydrogenase n=1 Tax=Saccharibacillus sacchari TaxID=456493 RepID=A0ACC6PF20_9BACL
MIQAVVYDSSITGRFAIRKVEAPKATLLEALVQVEAFSLNQGEVRDASDYGDGYRPGWDFAGIVIEPATSGIGPKKGTRVFGLLTGGAWAEQIAVPVPSMTEIPEGISVTQAATLPVAGLSALYTLRKGGLLIGKRLLITGSSGGVGLMLHQLASLSGAWTVGTARSQEKAGWVQDAGADQVIVGEFPPIGAKVSGPYDLIIDSVGGDTLTALVPMLKPGATLVSMGYSASSTAHFDIHAFTGAGGRTLYGFFLGEELGRQNGPADLALLGQLVVEQKLKPHLSIEAPWTDLNEVAHRLLNREFAGKVVLRIGTE